MEYQATLDAAFPRALINAHPQMKKKSVISSGAHGGDARVGAQATIDSEFTRLNTRLIFPKKAVASGRSI